MINLYLVLFVGCYFPNAASATGASAAKVSSSSPDCVAMPFLLPNSNVSNHLPLLVRAFFAPVLGSTAYDFDSVVSVPFFSKPHAFTRPRRKQWSSARRCSANRLPTARHSPALDVVTPFCTCLCPAQSVGRPLGILTRLPSPTTLRGLVGTIDYASDQPSQGSLRADQWQCHVMVENKNGEVTLLATSPALHHLKRLRQR